VRGPFGLLDRETERVSEHRSRLLRCLRMTRPIDYYEHKVRACESAAAAAEDENVRRVYLMLADEWRKIIRETGANKRAQDK
jgi:hypothetical protein